MYGPSADSAVRPGWKSRAIVSGFYATLVMLITFLFAYLVVQGLGNVQPPDQAGSGALTTAFYNLAHNPLIDFAATNLYVAVAIHFATGLVWALIYARFAEPHLGGQGWQRGALFALLPWLLSIAVFFPIVGAGPFGFGLGAGILPVLGNLILHLAYGVTLGLLYSPAGDLDIETFRPTASSADLEAMHHSEAWSAWGIVIGAAGGLVLGLAGTLAIASDAGGMVAGIPPAAMVVAAVVLGATLGGLIGSMAGLTPPAPGGLHRPS
jgi:hypothetical protein